MNNTAQADLGLVLALVLVLVAAQSMTFGAHR